MSYKRRNSQDSQPTSTPPAEYGIGWMPESARLPRHNQKKSLSDKIYRTPAVAVAGICAGIGVAVCILAVIISLIFGLRIYKDYDESGATIRYVGIIRRDVPSLGVIFLPDGETATVVGSRVRYSDGTRYKGGMDGLLFDGEGEFTDIDGNVYKGRFERGALEGEGEIVFADGGIFKGSFLNGERDGYGEYVGGDGSSYKGYYAEDVKSGFGEMVYSDGSVYQGYFKNGMRHGEGSYRFASGDIYTGEFRNNVIWGQGTYFFANGRVFTGEFKNGAPVTE